MQEDILWYLIRTELAFTSMALALSIYVVCRISSIHQLHVNFRILMASCLLGGNMFNICHLYMYRAVIFVDEPGRDHITPMLQWSAVFYWAGAVMAVTKFLVLGVERYFATRLRKDYEKRGALIGAVITVAHISLSLLTGLVMLVMYHRCVASYEQPLPANERSCAMEHFFYDGNLVYISLSYFTGVLCWAFGTVQAYFLYRINKSIKGDLESLSDRYQHRENIETLSAMLPGVLIYGVMLTVCWSAVVYSIINLEYVEIDAAEKQVAFHVTYVAMAGYNLFFCLYTLVGYKPLSVAVVNDARRLLRLPPMHLSAVVAPKEAKRDFDEKERYFGIMKDMWQ